ncbi:MAG: nuclear transport factor 2 family protein [Bacteroidota bacterium]
MKTYYVFAFLALVLISCAIGKDTSKDAASKAKDYVAIEGVIQNYFDGWLTGDTTLVGSAMHSTCNLKYVRDGKVARRDRAQYLSGFKPRPRLENAEGRIISIDITRTAAEAKIELETETRLFTDYFNLLKEGDRWYITDKVSTSIAKE